MTETRELRCAVEWRADDGRQSPGRIVGTLLTYGQRATDRPEVFAEGALSWPAGGIILNEQHARTQPIMRFEPVVDGAEVRIEAALPDTQRGRDAATMIRNGTMTGLSIEFRSLSEGMLGELREIRKAHLSAAALVDDPSYKGALEVRDKARPSGRVPLWL